MTAILALNAGSSSVKFSVYEAGSDPELLLEGQVENLGLNAHLVLDTNPKQFLDLGPADHKAALSAILDAIAPTLEGRTVVGVGHRIVHGGTEFTVPIELTPEAMEKLSTLEPLAPLHQPHNLSMVREAMTIFPGAVQIGCFDTAFHRTHPWVNDTFALPQRFYDEGVRRYGFHGLSYEYITGLLAQDFPELHAGRVVIAHLGNGASMCAVLDGRSIGSTMGFSALDGLPMGTRCGQLDPGVVLYLLSQGLGEAEILNILYRESGLKGLSGISHDMRTLLHSTDPNAQKAIDYYVFRIRRELGAMCAVLGGLDALIFCGGIGENAAPIRAQVLTGTHYLGLAVDRDANEQNALDISAGPTRALVIPTDEERIMARAVSTHLSARRPA